MAFTFDAIFAADPNNPANVAANAAITIFDPNDPGKAPITITDPTGSPIANPLTVNKNGFGSAFQHATLDRVGWSGGGFEGFFTSYEGMKNVATAAQAAAETAAATAGADAAAVADAAIGDATAEAEAAAASAAAAEAAAATAATAAANSAALVGAPADEAIAAAINGNGATKTALNATYATPASVASAIAPVQDQINFVADSTLTQKIKKAPDNITWVTTFQSGHTWNGNGAASVNVNSTEVKFIGSQGVKYGPTASPNVGRTLESATMAPIDMTGKLLVIAVKSLDDIGTGLTVYLANAGFTAYSTVGADANQYRSADGWVYLTITPVTTNSITGSFNIAAVERIRIIFNETSAGHSEYVGAVGYAPVQSEYPNGVVTIDFDDNAPGQFELARPLMLAKGYPATIYAIGSNADSNADGAMSTKDMHLLEDMFGWEIGAHSRTTADHVDMRNLTDAQLEDSILRVRQWLTTNKFKANGFAYPFGASDARVRAIASKYFSWGRTAGFNNSGANLPITTAHFNLGTAFNITAASITPLLDTAKARKQWVGLGFHSIVSGASAGGNMGSTDFATVLNYIESLGMAVVTPSTLLGLDR